MRYDNILVTLSAIFLLVFGALYARSAQLQLHFNSSQMESLNNRMEGLIGLVKDTSTKDKIYTDTIRKIEDRLSAAENEKNALLVRLDQLSLQVSRLQHHASLFPPGNVAADIRPVDLGEISIKK
ncbi:MAG TPA: hypothetical protein P5110_02015 [Candidatus Omnitrophota bacterium]|nr:hypothetical protein [Candidatus Omnitrophota bacterium]